MTETTESGLRDELANQRTVLANERTLLAYTRTALTLFVAGVSFIQFFDSLAVAALGWAFLPIAVAVQALGFYRYLKIRTSVNHRR